MVMLKLADDVDYIGEIRCILLIDGEDDKVSREGDISRHECMESKSDENANGNAHDLKIQMVHLCGSYQESLSSMFVGVAGNVINW
jgi:hypothetical protein